MVEKEKLGSLLNKLTTNIGDMTDSVDEKKKLLINIQNIVEEELTKDERLLLYEIIFEELSFRNLVMHPEFMIKQSNVRLRALLFSSGIFMSFFILIGLIFSDNVITLTIKNVFKHIFEMMTL